MPDYPPGTVPIAHGRFLHQTWSSWAIRRQGAACLYIDSSAKTWSCSPPDDWHARATISIDFQGFGGPPWVTTGMLRMTDRVVGVKLTFECGENFSRQPRHLTKRDRRRSLLPRGVRFLPFVLGKADYLAAAAAYNAKGRRIGLVTYDVPPRSPDLPPC
jgi:hypothetical protein